MCAVIFYEIVRYLGFSTNRVRRGIGWMSQIGFFASKRDAAPEKNAKRITPDFPVPRLISSVSSAPLWLPAKRV